MTTARVRARQRSKTTAQYIAGTFGVVFLVVGIAGFVPGLTSNLGDIEFAGHDSGAELLGLFQVSILHNVVHLLFGVTGLALARRHDSAVTFLIVGGVAYLVLTLYGSVVDLNEGANFLPFNGADNWLHLVLGVAMVVAGLATRRERGSRVV